MIEATIKSLAGRDNERFQRLVGCRVSILSMDDNIDKIPGCITVGCILKTKKGSRIRKERYQKQHYCDAILKDIVVEEYDED